MLWGQGVPRRDMMRVAAGGALCLAVIAFAYTATKDLGDNAVSPAQPSRPVRAVPSRLVRVIEMAPSPSAARKEQESAPQAQAAAITMSPPPPVRQPAVGVEPPPAPPRQQLASDDVPASRGHVVNDDFCAKYHMHRVDYLKQGRPYWRCMR